MLGCFGPVCWPLLCKAYFQHASVSLLPNLMAIGYWLYACAEGLPCGRIFQWLFSAMPEAALGVNIGGVGGSHDGS